MSEAKKERLQKAVHAPQGGVDSNFGMLVPRRGFDPLISTLKGWHPDLARRPGHAVLFQCSTPGLATLRVYGQFVQRGVFGEAGHQVHILHRLARGALDQVI